jgi:hypothetical protein
VDKVTVAIEVDEYSEYPELDDGFGLGVDIEIEWIVGSASSSSSHCIPLVGIAKDIGEVGQLHVRILKDCGEMWKLLFIITLFIGNPLISASEIAAPEVLNLSAL